MLSGGDSETRYDAKKMPRMWGQFWVKLLFFLCASCFSSAGTIALSLEIAIFLQIFRSFYLYQRIELNTFLHEGKRMKLYSGMTAAER